VASISACTLDARCHEGGAAYPYRDHCLTFRFSSSKKTSSFDGIQQFQKNRDGKSAQVRNDEGRLIELAMLKFEYGSDCTVFRVLDQFCRLREATVAIPIEITKLTGITPEMVAGKTITPEEVEHFASSAAVVMMAQTAVLVRGGETSTWRPWRES
jgi:hypothetical protein